VGWASEARRGTLTGVTDAIRIDGPDLERVRRLRAEVALVLPGADTTAWGATLARALAETLEAGGARLAAVIDAGDTPAFAARAMARALVLDPSAIVSRPVGGVAAVDAHRSVARADAALVLLDDAPAGLLPDRDFATVVRFDEAAIGVALAELACGSVSHEGGLGILGPSTDPMAGSDRERALRAWVRSKRPDARIGAGRYGEAASPGAVALRLFADDPGLEAVVVMEDEAAREVVRRLDAAGHRPAVVTMDLGAEAAVELATGGLVRGVVARQPWEQGVLAATATLLALIGRPMPPAVLAPFRPVTRDSVLEAWLETWHEPAPEALSAARWGKPRT
jgi:ribose transport system substrate-binding protein